MRTSVATATLVFTNLVQPHYSHANRDTRIPYGDLAFHRVTHRDRERNAHAQPDASPADGDGNRNAS